MSAGQGNYVTGDNQEEITGTHVLQRIGRWFLPEVAMAASPPTMNMKAAPPCATPDAQVSNAPTRTVETGPIPPKSAPTP